MASDLLSVKDVAERYGVNQDTVRSWIRALLLPAINTARPTASRARWRISPDGIAEFERNRAPQPAQSPKRRKRKSQARQFV